MTWIQTGIALGMFVAALFVQRVILAREVHQITSRRISLITDDERP